MARPKKSKYKPREIVVLYSDMSDRVSKLVFAELTDTKYPISRRNLRWWTGNTQAFLYVLTVGIPKNKAPTDSNCQHYAYEGYASHCSRRSRNGEEVIPKAEFQEREAARIANQINEWLSQL